MISFWSGRGSLCLTKPDSGCSLWLWTRQPLTVATRITSSPQKLRRRGGTHGCWPDASYTRLSSLNPLFGNSRLCKCERTSLPRVLSKVLPLGFFVTFVISSCPCFWTHGGAGGALFVPRPCPPFPPARLSQPVTPPHYRQTLRLFPHSLITILHLVTSV
jgi:hypothetical protein